MIRLLKAWLALRRSARVPTELIDHDKQRELRRLKAQEIAVRTLEAELDALRLREKRNHA